MYIFILISEDASSALFIDVFKSSLSECCIASLHSFLTYIHGCFGSLAVLF